MSLLVRNLQFIRQPSRSKSILTCKYATESHYHVPCREDEYTETPRYPPIEKVGKIPEKQKSVHGWHDKIKRQDTVEEKLFEVNVPRYWGWKSLMITEGVSPYNNLDFVQHVTRTHIMKTEDLPSHYSNLKEKSFQLCKELKNDIEDAIGYQLNMVQHSYKSKDLSPLEGEKKNTEVIINTLNRVLMNELLRENKCIEDVQVDYNPRIEAFWACGGMEVPAEKLKERKEDEDKVEEEWTLPMDRWIQYTGSPVLQLRHELPLPEIVEQRTALAESHPVSSFTYDPAVVGYQTERRHGTNIPGFWPGESREFAYLSYHSSNHVKHRPESYGAQDAIDTSHCQAVLASYSWLLPLACYQGFSTFHDPTYPTTTQTVVTDGKNFTMAVYQLNTTSMYEENPTTNPFVNLCWVTPTTRLYESIKEGKLEGFNEEVLAKLIQMYLIRPAVREGVSLKPYLGDDVKRLADIEQNERRVWLEREFKHFSSNRPRHRLDHMYEVYDWERIYKIEHKMRPYDARRRPFELKEKPYHRKMSDHLGEYIPRCLRPDADLPKPSQKRRKPTYYPK